jgi:hypothetical protein
MADVIELNGKLEITSIAADWNYRTSKPDSWPDFPRLASIKFNPGAANDKVKICEESDGGPEIFYVSCSDVNDQRVEYYHGQHATPYIDFSASTLSAGHKVVIKLWREA